MIFKNKLISVSLSFLLLSVAVFATAPELNSANYSQNDNQLTLVFDQNVKLDAVLLGLISFDNDNGGPVADLTLQGGSVYNPGSLVSDNEVVLDLLYGDIIDSFTGDFFGDANHLFELWGININQVKSLEAMVNGALQIKLLSGAVVSANNEANAEQIVSCTVSTADEKPMIQSAIYDANINILSIRFDSDVQFDLLAEDRSINGGPGNGLLQNPISGNDDGEDRNGNGLLDFEANIRPFDIGLVSDAGSMTLENIARVLQQTDNDTMDIELTGNDAKRLEATIGYSNLHLDVNEWAFVNANYNPNLASDLAVQVIPDSVNFVADSASYDLSKNVMSVYFSNVMAAGRTITLTNPSPVYSKFHVTSNVGTYTLNGVEGNPSSIPTYNNTAFKFKLPIPDQAGLEALVDGSELTLSINSFALYDNYSNGNNGVQNVPIRVTSSVAANEQPPILISSSYDFDSHTVTLTWDLNLGVGFYKGEALTVLDAADNQTLTGITFWDNTADSTVTLGEGMLYYSGSKKNTYIELSEADAIRLETHPNLNAFQTYVDRDVFNAFLFLNGNTAIGAADAIGLDIIADTTAPFISSARLNVFTRVADFGTNEPVKYSELTVSDFSLAGVTLSGTLLNEAEQVYSSNISIELDETAFSALTSLPDSIFIAADLITNNASLTNITNLHSDSDTIRTSIGRTFYLRSFEAFAPSPTLRFGALKLIGEDCDIYVDDEMWADEKVNAANLLEIQTAFESSTPVDSTRGIKAIVDAYYGGIPDTDNNGKLIIYLADLLDEYDLGRNDTKDTYFENGFMTLADTADGQYSNHADMIYLDVDPQIIGVAPYTEWDETMLNALTYQYSLLSAISNSPSQERWINYGIALKMQEQTVGNIKFFGEDAKTKATASNELTYIALNLLKSREDLYNVYNYLTYLTEKFPGSVDSLEILKNIAQSDLIGVAAVDAALEALGYDISVEQSFQNYAVACFLDLNQLSASESLKYGGIYNFEALALNGAPGGKNAGNLPWDKSIGSGAPFAKSAIQPWSFSFYVARAYFIDIQGNFNIVSPDLNSDDTLVFDGYDGIEFKATKILLHSGYLETMTQDFEAVDFELDPLTSRGQLPMTTDSSFPFRATVPDTARGVQLLALVVSKTDYAQPPVTYDYVFTNVTEKPELGEFYAVQNPDAQNYLDLFVVSERPIYGLTGEEGAVARVNGSIDTVSVTMPLLDSSDGIVSVYSGKYTLQASGDYSLVFSGRDQNGVSLDPVTRNISVGLARPNSNLAMQLPNGIGELSVPENSVSATRYLVAGEYSRSMSAQLFTLSELPEGVQAIQDVFYIGTDGLQLNREASLSLSINSENLNDPLGVYVIIDDEWRYIGGHVNSESSTIEVNTGQLGRFVIAAGEHPEESLNIPKVFTLEQNYPNPFNPTTTISFSVPQASSVTVKVFNMLGQEIVTLADGYFAPGLHELQWNASDASQVRVASGVYFYAVESADNRLVKKMVLLK